MKPSGIKARRFSGGFTLVEMAVSMAILTMVIVGAWNVFTLFQRSYNETTLMRTAAARASLALDRMVYGVSTNPGLREVQSSSIVITYPSGGWKIAYTNIFFDQSNLFLQYTTNLQCITWSNSTSQSSKFICTNVIASTLNCTTKGFTTNGCAISVTVAEKGGGRIDTNTMTTFVEFRN
ncbi:MAG: prepilin-type N-terminal cleavage/methylation domain-containing protein [Verrucomicrobiia bacterium]|jgi:prepilin-type N-terminal cleavage/methylation domain-containing protein